MIEFTTAVGWIKSLRSALSLFGRRPARKLLEASVVGRGVVIEVPYGEPYQVLDLEGNSIRHGIYILGVRLWNRGGIPIHRDDISMPFAIELGAAARILSVQASTIVDGLTCVTEQISNNAVTVAPNGFNPGDDLTIGIYFTSPDPYVSVQVVGRVLGQTDPVDQTGGESRASAGERAVLTILSLWFLLSLPAVILFGWFIYKDYGIKGFITPEVAPQYFVAPFYLGLMMPMFFVLAKSSEFFERRRNPIGYPLESDFQPPFWENFGEILGSVFKGRRYRLSASFFSRGRPIVFPRKGIRRRSVKDWMH